MPASPSKKEVSAAPRFAGLGSIISIAGVLIAGKFISDKINGIIDHVNEVVRGILAQIKRDLDDLINTLETKYQDNLNLTLDKLDDFTRNKLLEITDLFGTINQGVQDDINLITSNLQNTLQKAILELEDSLKKTILIAGETAVYVVDRATYQIVFIIALVALGVGLIAFPWVLLKTGLPEGFTRILILSLMGLFVLFFGALAAVPKFRAWLIRFTGLGIKAKIDASGLGAGPVVISVDPATLQVGKDTELKLWGTNLLPDGQAPTATLAGSPVPLRASSPDTLVLDVSQFTWSGDSGSYPVVLAYANGKSATAVVHLVKPVQPANLTVSLVIKPNPVQKGNPVTATITVKNAGPGPIEKPFKVFWYPDGVGTYERLDIARLDAGESKVLVQTRAYPVAGKFTSYAVVDPDHEIDETNAGETDNKSDEIQLTVSEPPKPQDPGIRFYTDTLANKGLQAFLTEDTPETKFIFPGGADMADTISAIELVGDSLVALVYEHSNYGGRVLYVDHNMDTPELAGKAFNDMISSVKLLAKGSIGGITIYEDAGYKGKSSFLLRGRNYSQYDLAKLGGFVYPSYGGTGITISKISSIQFHGVDTVTAYLYPNKKVVIPVSGGGIPNLKNVNGVDLNDKIIAFDV